MKASSKIEQKINVLKSQIKKFSELEAAGQGDLEKKIQALISIHKETRFKKNYLTPSSNSVEIDSAQKDIEAFDLELSNLQTLKTKLTELEEQINNMKQPILFGKQAFIDKKDNKIKETMEYKGRINDLEEKIKKLEPSIEAKRKKVQDWKIEQEKIEDQYNYDFKVLQEQKKRLIGELRKSVLGNDENILNDTFDRPEDMRFIAEALKNFCNENGLSIDHGETNSGDLIIEIRGDVADDKRHLIYIILTEDYNGFSIMYFYSYTSILADNISDLENLIKFNNIPLWGAKLQPLVNDNPIKVLRITYEMLTNFQKPTINETLCLVQNGFEVCTTLNNAIKGLVSIEEIDRMSKVVIEDIYVHPSFYRTVVDIADNPELILSMTVVDEIELIEFDRQTLLIRSFGHEGESEVYMQLCSTPQFKFIRFLSIIKEQEKNEYKNNQLYELFEPFINYHCISINKINGVNYFTNKYDQIIHEPANKMEIEYILSHLLASPFAYSESSISILQQSN